MVRELQDRGAELRAARRHEAELARALEIAREQQAPTARVHPHHERGVVAPGRAADARRPERLDADVAELEHRLARRALGGRHAARGGDLEQLAEAGLGARAGREPEARDGQRAQHRHEPAAMVEVGVARDHQLEAPHAERTERGQHHALARVEAARASAAVEGRSAVDQERRPPALDDRRVALSDVEVDDAWSRRIEARRGPERGRGGGERGEPEPQRRAARAHAGEPERARGREAERTGRHAEPRRRTRGERDRTVEEQRGELRGRREGGRERASCLGKRRRGEAARERERQQHERSQRDREPVREPAERRDHAEVERDERGRRGGGAGGGAEREPERLAEARERAMRRVARRRRRAPDERRRRREGELHAGCEGGGGIRGQHGEPRGAEGARRRERAARELREREQRQEGERALHRRSEAGEERVERAPAERNRDGAAARVAARRERRGAARERGRRPVERRRHQPQVEPRDRHQVRETEPRERGARGRPERRGLPQPERGEEVSAGPLPGQAPGSAPAEVREEIQELGLRALNHCMKRGMERCGGRAEPTARERARAVGAARVRSAARGCDAERDADPAAPRQLGEGGRSVGEHVEPGRGRHARRRDRRDLGELEGRAARTCADPSLDHGLERSIEPRRPGRFAARSEREPAGCEGRDERTHEASPAERAAERRRVEREPEPLLGVREAEVGAEEAGRVRGGQRGKEPSQAGAPRDRGGGKLVATRARRPAPGAACGS